MIAYTGPGTKRLPTCANMWQCITTRDVCIPRSGIPHRWITKTSLTTCPESVDHYNQRRVDRAVRSLGQRRGQRRRTSARAPKPINGLWALPYIIPNGPTHTTGRPVNHGLLIIDELRFVPRSKTGAGGCSNLCHSVMNGPLLDRLPPVYILEMNGEHYRLRHSRRARSSNTTPKKRTCRLVASAPRHALAT